jgi:hypothetical protein
MPRIVLQTARSLASLVMTAKVSLFAVALSSGPALAQPGAPSGWQWHLDRPVENVTGRDAPPGAWQFQEMIPGMHVTSGPGATVYPTAESASGRFMIDATIVLFPNSTDAGYGVMFGGSKLGTPDATWSALLLSADGRFSVVRHAASGTTRLIDWTANETILKRGAETVSNQLRVSVEPDSIRFLVNAKRVGAIPRSATEPAGQFGLRLDAGIKVRVTNVDVTRRLLKR